MVHVFHLDILASPAAIKNNHRIIFHFPRSLFFPSPRNIVVVSVDATLSYPVYRHRRFPGNIWQLYLEGQKSKLIGFIHKANTLMENY